MAQKTGLPASVLARADALRISSPVQVNRLMANLSECEREITEREAAKEARAEARETELKGRMREEARQKNDEAARFLKELRLAADGLLEDMRGTRAIEEARRIAPECIREMGAKVNAALPAPQEEAANSAPVSPRVGDRVRIPLMNCAGEVFAFHGEDELSVRVNGKSLRLACKAVEVLAGEASVPPRRGAVTHDVALRGGVFLV